ncbi:MAG: alpha/beta fold hydrolase [Gemmatimonadota bacterium]|nr:alpha/beta fold hydrolase [Gemmatimonadota bacterium]
MKNLTADGSTVSFEFPEALPAATFTGTFDGSRIHGVVTTPVESASGVLDLLRWSGEAVPYRTQQVRFASGDVSLRGTLFVPNSRGPHPGVVLLHGSGPQTRESYISYFADQFARNGIAALIYDKRNIGRTDIPVSQQGAGTFGELADDATAAVRYLRARPDVADPRRIGLWGLSEGAWIAPIAADRLDGIAFLVLVSGGGVTPALQEIYDDEARLRARGFSPAEVARATALLKLANAYVRSKSDQDWTRFQRELASVRDEPWFADLDPLPITLPRESPAWDNPDLDYNPVPLLERLRLPVLMVLGEKDELTPVRQTARLTSSALRKAKNPDYVVREIPGADHQLWVTRAAGDSWLDQRPAAGWLEEMIAWVSARARRP